MCYELKLEHKGIIKKFTGTVDDSEFIRAFNAIQNHAHFEHLYYVINHFLEVAHFKVSEPVLANYFAGVSATYRINPYIKLAFVTQNAEIESLIYRYLRSSLLPYRSRVFDSVIHAKDWCKGIKHHASAIRPISYTPDQAKNTIWTQTLNTLALDMPTKNESTLALANSR